MVLQHNSIFRSRHKKPQTLRPARRVDKFVSVIPQQIQFSLVSVNAE